MEGALSRDARYAKASALIPRHARGQESERIESSGTTVNSVLPRAIAVQYDGGNLTSK
jgi:hypothetical protein